jgi:hypothetical protein
MRDFTMYDVRVHDAPTSTLLLLHSEDSHPLDVPRPRLAVLLCGCLHVRRRRRRRRRARAELLCGQEARVRVLQPVQLHLEQHLHLEHAAFSSSRDSCSHTAGPCT